MWCIIMIHDQGISLSTKYGKKQLCRYFLFHGWIDLNLIQRYCYSWLTVIENQSWWCWWLLVLLISVGLSSRIGDTELFWPAFTNYHYHASNCQQSCDFVLHWFTVSSLRFTPDMIPARVDFINLNTWLYGRARLSMQVGIFILFIKIMKIHDRKKN